MVGDGLLEIFVIAMNPLAAIAALGDGVKLLGTEVTWSKGPGTFLLFLAFYRLSVAQRTLLRRAASRDDVQIRVIVRCQWPQVPPSLPGPDAGLRLSRSSGQCG